MSDYEEFYVECPLLSVGPMPKSVAEEKANRFDRLYRNTACHCQTHQVVPASEARATEGDRSDGG